VSSVIGDIELDVTSLGDVTCRFVAAVLMNSFGFDSLLAAEIVANNIRVAVHELNLTKKRT